MSTRITNSFGVAADTLAALAIAAWVFAVSMPYRLSPTQESLLGVALFVSLAAPVLAILLGFLSLLGGARARRMGWLAIGFAIPTLLLALLTMQPHSVSRW